MVKDYCLARKRGSAFWKGKLAVTLLTIAISVMLLCFGALLAIRMADEAKLRNIWKALRTDDESGETFSPGMIDGLPDTAKRYLLHAIRSGTPLAASVEIAMVGRIKPGGSEDWVPFEASQVIGGGRGFVWKAKVWMTSIVSLSGADHYFKGRGRMRFALFGLIPLVRASGPDVDRSAAGRLLIESVMLPSALLPQRGAVWQDIDDRQTRVTLSVDDLTTSLMLTIDEEGCLEEAVMMRYQGGGAESDPGEVPFGVVVEKTECFSGFAIPSRIRAGWWYGTDRYADFFRAEIVSARFF